MTLALGIEIGGTKLQAGIGTADGNIIALERDIINPAIGAEGIRHAIPALVDSVIQTTNLSISNLIGIGVGFGGPVNSKTGITCTSHQIEGWDNFPLQDWFEDQYKIPTKIQNDASLAGMAEAICGAGTGYKRIFYMTIGSGIGGGLITNGIIDEGQGLGAGEIGHTWVTDPETGEPDKLENLCSGWSIGIRAQEAIESGERSLLTDICQNIDDIDAKAVYQAAEQGDLLARTILEESTQTLALAISNVIALFNPEKIIIGGGVSLMGPLFWDTLIYKVEQFAFEPFLNTYEIVPAKLKEDVVIVGGILLGHQIHPAE